MAVWTLLWISMGLMICRMGGPWIEKLSLCGRFWGTSRNFYGWECGNKHLWDLLRKSTFVVGETFWLTGLFPSWRVFSEETDLELSGLWRPHCFGDYKRFCCRSLDCEDIVQVLEHLSESCLFLLETKGFQLLRWNKVCSIVWTLIRIEWHISPANWILSRDLPLPVSRFSKTVVKWPWPGGMTDFDPTVLCIIRISSDSSRVEILRPF